MENKKCDMEFTFSINFIKNIYKLLSILKNKFKNALIVFFEIHPTHLLSQKFSSIHIKKERKKKWEKERERGTKVSLWEIGEYNLWEGRLWFIIHWEFFIELEILSHVDKNWKKKI